MAERADPVFDAPTAEFLEGGCALIIGVVGRDGEPFATRGWGLDVLGDGRVRVLLAADDEGGIGRLGEGSDVAVTACDVRTLRSMQLKGRSLGVEDGTDADRARAGRFIDAFFADVADTDGTPRAHLDRLTPADYVAVTIEIAEQYNQTPGPGAGARLEAASS